MKWNDFVDNVTSSFGQLRTDKDFSDVTLVSGDGHQIKAHRLALASGSLVFKGLLSQNSAANPVIFMRGVKSGELNSIVDFLYLGEINIHQYDLNEIKIHQDDLGETNIHQDDLNEIKIHQDDLGETNIHQDDLNEFLALAEDLQLKGLTENRKQVMETSKHPETERESVLTSFKEGRISTIGNARKKVSGENQMRKTENSFMASGQDSSNILSVMEDFISEKAGKSGVTFKDGNDVLETEISKLLSRVEGTLPLLWED